MEKIQKAINGLAMQIDLAGHDIVDGVVRKASLLPRIVNPVATFAVAFAFVALWRNRFDVAFVIATPLAIACALFESVIPLLEDKTATLMAALAGLGAVVGLVVGGMAGTQSAGFSAMAVAGLTYAAAGSVAGVALGWAMQFIVGIGALVTSGIGLPFSWPINFVLAAIFQRKVDKLGWKTDSGLPLLKFGTRGLQVIANSSEPVFVAAPELRRQGQAAKQGIPRFTGQQILDRGLVQAAMASAAAAASTVYAADPAHFAQGPTWFNPATGLPTLGNIAGGLDIAGNSWGDNSMSGAGAPDGAGSSFGGPGNI